jgi:hypothetical protein
MWQRIDIIKHVHLRPSMYADSLDIQEKKTKRKEQSFMTTTIMTKSDITKLFLTLYLCQHICLTQLSTLADTLLGATTDFEHY